MPSLHFLGAREPWVGLELRSELIDGISEKSVSGREEDGGNAGNWWKRMNVTGKALLLPLTTCTENPPCPSLFLALAQLCPHCWLA
jgi:hypothetical protein